MLKKKYILTICTNSNILIVYHWEFGHLFWTHFVKLSDEDIFEILKTQKMFKGTLR